VNTQWFPLDGSHNFGDCGNHEQCETDRVLEDLDISSMIDRELSKETHTDAEDSGPTMRGDTEGTENLDCLFDELNNENTNCLG
jgi:hypothetical protein